MLQVLYLVMDPHFAFIYQYYLPAQRSHGELTPNSLVEQLNQIYLFQPYCGVIFIPASSIPSPFPPPAPSSASSPHSLHTLSLTYCLVCTQWTLRACFQGIGKHGVRIDMWTMTQILNQCLPVPTDQDLQDNPAVLLQFCCFLPWPSGKCGEQRHCPDLEKSHLWSGEPGGKHADSLILLTSLFLLPPAHDFAALLFTGKALQGAAAQPRLPFPQSALFSTGHSQTSPCSSGAFTLCQCPK